MVRLLLASLAFFTLALPSVAQEPVGTVVGWHADSGATPPLSAGWVRVDGQLVQDVGSPFDGLYLPDLNGATMRVNGLFLRGASTTGGLEQDALQGHAHDSTNNASNGQRYGICPAFMEPGFGAAVIYRAANVTVAGPIDDGVHGAVRVDDETRPTNMSVVWILKTGAGELPVGSVVAWHPDFAPLGSVALPAGWARCGGQVLEDPQSPLSGTRVPDLNPSARFLRGGVTSGIAQEDALQDHGHSVTSDVKRKAVSGTSYDINPGSADPTRPATIGARDAKSDGTHGAPRVANETRPVNMSVVWILKTRLGAPLPEGALVAWHNEPAAKLGPLPRGRAAWYPCDGTVVQTVGSPYAGARLPDLNQPGRFLRGGTSSGVFQADAFQGHWHDVQHDAFSYQFNLASGNALWGGCGDDFQVGALSIGGVSGARTADETRPANMGAPWILYLRGNRGPRAAIVSGATPVGPVQ